MTPNIRLVNAAWESLLTAHTHLLRDFAADSVWKEHQLSMAEYDVLYTLSKSNEPTRVAELRERVLLSQPALSRLIDRLVARALVSREPDPRDKRAVLLQLTPSGRELQRAVGRRHAQRVHEAIAPRLSETDLLELQRIASLLTTPAGASTAAPAPDSTPVSE